MPYRSRRKKKEKDMNIEQDSELYYAMLMLFQCYVNGMSMLCYCYVKAMLFKEKV